MDSASHHDASGHVQQEKRRRACVLPRVTGVHPALAGVALGLAGALGLLTLPLREFRVDGARHR